MSGRTAITTLVGALGVAMGVVGCAVVVAVTLVALGVPADSRAEGVRATAPPPRPTELVVALTLEDPALQAGVLRGSEVILARGLEVDVARALARRLRILRVRFVNVHPRARLLTSGARPWHLAIAGVEASRAAGTAADLSVPYLGTDQAVLLRRGLPRPRSLADLRRRVVCARRGSDGARALAATVRPQSRPLLAATSERLLQLVRTGMCDAALVDGIGVGRLVAGRGALLGPVAARVEHGSGLVVAVTRGGPIAVTEVDRVLRRLRADGTLHRLALAWFGIDPGRLRKLR